MSKYWVPNISIFKIYFCLFSFARPNKAPFQISTHSMHPFFQSFRFIFVEPRKIMVIVYSQCLSYKCRSQLLFCGVTCVVGICKYNGETQTGYKHYARPIVLRLCWEEGGGIAIAMLDMESTSERET